MRKRLQSPSPSMIVALIALVVSMTGVAVAANQIGGKDIKRNAIKTSKIKDAAVTTNKIRDAAVTAAKLAPGTIPSNSLADGAVTTTKLADGAVTTAKLDPSERSEAFTASHGQITLPPATDTVAIQVTLPTPGNFVVTVTSQIGNNSGAANFVGCTLLDANNPLASSVSRTDATNTFQDTISLTGVSDGGVVRLSCNPDAGASARNLVLTAVRVNTVTSLTSTP